MLARSMLLADALILVRIATGDVSDYAEVDSFATHVLKDCAASIHKLYTKARLEFRFCLKEA